MYSTGGIVMKKVFLLLVSLFLCFSFIGCSNVIQESDIQNEEINEEKENNNRCIYSSLYWFSIDIGN